ncbi:hypothetical protein HPB52_014812 [Rhipicephalus sanguineus]|uniref:P2X purinoreceptor 7 intracellular domain-containing protein n=1 Tax=Rhipicephalus sanguineus TaxID=34632 RepID=A0A9D4PEH3_RHISA|nr:hypothetical protein HPB52_014812 [Rhipicephalus sanguineus]
MSSLDNLSELEKRILARMRAQNLDPYQVGPERHASTDDSDSDGSDGRPPTPPAARLENADWCRCKNCIVMPTATECVCCWDYAEINRDLACVTMDPYFRTLCLDAVVLRIAFIDVHNNGEDDDIEDDHKWTWGYLGRHNRKVLPSCVVRQIRERFPSPSYRGFRPPNLL